MLKQWNIVGAKGGTTRLSFIERLRNPADTRSWTHFHRQYGELLLGYARRLGAPHDIAEDVVQEVEMYLFRSIGTFRRRERKGSFRAYLRSSVVHALERRAQKKSRQEAVLDPHVFDALAKSDVAEDPQWKREEYLHRIRVATREIASEFAPATVEAFRMYVLCNRPVTETADLLGMSRESVYQAKSRVLKRLKEHVRSMDSAI